VKISKHSIGILAHASSPGGGVPAPVAKEDEVKFNRFTLAAIMFVVSLVLFSGVVLASASISFGMSLGSAAIPALCLFLAFGLLLRKRHFRWICGVVSLVLAAGMFFGSVVPSLTSRAEVAPGALPWAAMVIMVLLTVVPIVASYLLLVDGSVRQYYQASKPSHSGFQIAFRAYWIALLVCVVLVIGDDIVRLTGG